jgi:hypothetical protein
MLLQALFGLLRLWKLGEKSKNAKCSNHYGYYIVNANQSLLSPHLFSIVFKNKKGEDCFLFGVSIWLGLVVFSSS